MSEQVAISTNGDVVRPFTIRLSDEVRTQLEVLAEINGRSATEESRIALADWVTRAKGDPELKKRAESVQKRLEASAEAERKRIEREADQKRQAILAVLGGAGDESAPSADKHAEKSPAGGKAPGKSSGASARASSGSSGAATSKRSPAKSAS